MRCVCAPIPTSSTFIMTFEMAKALLGGRCLGSHGEERLILWGFRIVNNLGIRVNILFFQAAEEWNRNRIVKRIRHEVISGGDIYWMPEENFGSET